jgi:hypothetical protein
VMELIEGSTLAECGESCLMQDEPGREVCFSHKMSLEEQVRMLGVDRQRASGTKTKPGADPGISRSQR